MENNNGNNTALALTTNIVGQVLLPADLTALDALVTKLGERSACLQPEEKAAAVKAIEDWDASVTDRIRANACFANEVLAFLDGRDMGGGTVQRCVELFHDAVGDTPEYAAYISAFELAMDARREKPVDEPVTNGMTMEEADKARAANRAAELRWRRQVDAADAGFAKAVKAYIKSILGMPETKDAMSKLRAYARKAARLAAECSDKAAKAKINISISDKDTRELLHELMDFAKKF